LYTYVLNNPLNFTDVYGLAPGDPFPNADGAAIDAANYARQFGGQDIEYGGWIYDNGNFCSYNITAGGPNNIPGSWLEEIRPAGATDIWHTHPMGRDPLYAEHFSRGDRNTSNSEGVGVYLNTPSGVNIHYNGMNEPPERIVQ
ncbi:DUF4329 domain-containing protein, partial [Endothiovibrio diazotrophicus]